MCILMYTEYLHNLLFSDDVEKYGDVVDILENWENYQSIDDVKKINNVHINKAIEELENNKELMKLWNKD